MEIAGLAVGRLKSGPEHDLCVRYLDRARKAGRALGLSGFGFVEVTEGRAARAAERIAAEAAALIALVEPGGRLVCLDPGGALLDSEAFAAALARDAAEAVPRTTFVVGGPDGLGDEMRQRADRLVSFGRLTWPHQLARIMIAEQLYRATTILSGHPYHRA